MNFRYLTATAAVAVSLAAAFGHLLLARAEDSVDWLGNFSAAQAMARQTGKPIFAAFR